MTGKLSILLASSALVALAACSTYSTSWDQELGAEVDKGNFGNATMNNVLIQTGQLDYAVALAQRFAAEVPDTINFEFNSSELSDEAKAVLQKQANFIRQFPEVRFRVFGHTDLVGSDGYNNKLGLRRARAAVAYLVSLGVDKSRVEAVISYGETRPLIASNEPEMRNRRTVTEVSGFVQSHPLVLNGKYAEVIWRSYTGGATDAPAADAGGTGG